MYSALQNRSTIATFQPLEGMATLASVLCGSLAQVKRGNPWQVQQGSTGQVQLNEAGGYGSKIKGPRPTLDGKKVMATESKKPAGNTSMNNR